MYCDINIYKCIIFKLNIVSIQLCDPSKLKNNSDNKTHMWYTCNIYHTNSSSI